MTKLLLIAAIGVGGYLWLSQNPIMAHRLHLTSGTGASGFAPTVAPSIGAAAVGVAGRAGN